MISLKNARITVQLASLAGILAIGSLFLTACGGGGGKKVYFGNLEDVFLKKTGRSFEDEEKVQNAKK